jgi:hypothetical protein
MGCRVGITTNLDDRYAHWKGQYPHLYDWQTWGPMYQYQAQSVENNMRRQYGCDGSPGGPQIAGAVWHVYKFRF